MSKSHTAEALVLTCMDFRMTSHVAAYLERRGLAQRYDIVALAGGAMGVMASEASNWAETFWDQLDLAVSLHGIKRVIIIDHRDCGACKVLVSPDCGTDREVETRTHVTWMSRLANEIRRKSPELNVEMLLMDLDGRVEEFTAPAPA